MIYVTSFNNGVLSQGVLHMPMVSPRRGRRHGATPVHCDGTPWVPGRFSMGWKRQQSRTRDTTYQHVRRIQSSFSNSSNNVFSNNKQNSPETSERSSMVNKEVVLFLLQLELDSCLQRALTYERFDEVKELRERRNKVDGALRMMQQAKGYGCGSRRAAQTDQFGNFAPSALTIRAQLSKAIEEEDYVTAANLRDALAEIEEKSAEANLPCPVGSPEFSLGQMIVHNTKGYRGVICGWDYACCETDVWKRETDAGKLPHGTDQVFYHVLVDIADWPMLDDEVAPVAYVAEELLDKVTLADFDSDEPLVNTPFQHPYSYLLFLGTDSHGNMIPCRQLREKYCVERCDDLSDEDDSDDDRDDFDDFPRPPGGSGSSSEDNTSWGGGNSVPGIDMSSLE